MVVWRIRRGGILDRVQYCLDVDLLLDHCRLVERERSLSVRSGLTDFRCYDCSFLFSCLRGQMER